MSLTAEERHDVVEYRLEKAGKTLEEAKANIAFKYWSLIANRLYYAAYYAVSALLVANGYLPKSHEGTIHLFGLHIVNEGILPQEMGKLGCMPLVEPTEQLIEKVSELAKEKLQEPMQK